VGWQGNYLAQTHTAEHFRSEHFLPELMRRDSRQTWESKGAKTAIDLANERVREILARHEPRELDPGVEKELLGYLAAVRQRAVADFEAAEWED
jgi:trimethylamine--corrinoid protein Co-methyltransferase